ncbi:MAG: hypothetical protein IJR07_11935 [Bacteroidaceae bacterium]|nr:hypothetical protein [Bacteroidaceae bacterium]
MFCVQQWYDKPTVTVNRQQFWTIVRSSKVARTVREAREEYEKGNKPAYEMKKRSLPLMVFICTFDVSENKENVKGCWRLQKHVNLNGLVVADYDHLKGDVRQLWETAYSRLSEEDKARILLVYVTPSGHGLKVVFTADVEVGNLIDNQKDFSNKLDLQLDESCKDGCRGAFITTANDIISINEEKLFTYENEEFGKKYNDQYRAGNSGATNTDDVARQTDRPSAAKGGQVAAEQVALPVIWRGHDLQQIINQRFAAKLPCKEDSNRHKESLKLASDLLIMLDGDKTEALAVLRAQSWVQEIINERNENVEATVKDAASNLSDREKKSLNPYPSKEMQAAILSVTGKSYHDHITPNSTGDNAQSSIASSPSKKEEDIYAQLPLDKWADDLQALADHFPCMKELFINVHPHKLPAVLFSSGAMFGTLMTRAWYHFWYDPEIMRRLNYSIFIIGDPGSGKNVIEKFYFKIIEPIIQADQLGIDAVNRYKEGRTERSTSTKAQKGEALKKPVVGIRVHPARTATGEFIRHMLAAKEMVQGKEINLHMFSFDSELDNVTKNNKGGDWKDREVLELKAFHNEQDGQMYANQESVTGMFNVFWNFIYTGTPYALHRKVNQRNYGTGMSTRLAVIPLPDTGMAERYQQVDLKANETLKEWAFRLDKVEGEIPIEPLNDETFDWQSNHMEIAQFNGDKADRSLLKRIPYYGIGISLPFILMRHWDEWQENKSLTMDNTDKRLCRLVMEIQYRSQQFFFGEMAFNYYADQNKEFVVRRRTSRYEECYRKLQDEFKTQQLMDAFNISQSSASRCIDRLLKDKVIERVAYGAYRKLLKELP